MYFFRILVASSMGQRSGCSLNFFYLFCFNSFIVTLLHLDIMIPSSYKIACIVGKCE